MKSSLVYLLFASFLVSGSESVAVVEQIYPTIGSAYGGTELTFIGRGFAENVFDFGEDAHVGNRVELVSETEKFECDVVKDACTEEMIVCITRPMPINGRYKARISIDGESLPESSYKWCTFQCTLETLDRRTPWVSSVSPISGTPESVIKMRGTIWSDLYEPTKNVAANGRTVRIKRAYNNGQKCDLKEEGTDNLYGIKLDFPEDPASVWGSIACRTGGTYVGNQNISFVLRGGPDGRSEIFSVSPSIGGARGGTPITIYGKYFDETDAPTEVLIGGEQCEVIELSDEKIVCLTPPKVTQVGYVGNRGFNLGIWNRSEVLDAHLTSRLTDLYSTSEPDYHLFLDDSSLKFSTESDVHLAQWRGYFVPPTTGFYTFKMRSYEDFQLFLSTSENPADSVRVATSFSNKLHFDSQPEQNSDPIHLEEGKLYYMETQHKQRGVWTLYEMAMVMSNTSFTSAQTSLATDEKQTISMLSTQQDDIQLLTFENWETQASVSEVQKVKIATTAGNVMYRLGVYGMFTELLAVGTPATMVERSLRKLLGVPSQLTVTGNIVDGEMEYTISFNSETGSYPMIDVIQDGDGEDITSTVNRVIEGVPSMTSVVLQHEGAISSPIPYNNLNSATVLNALNGIHRVHCPEEFNQGIRGTFLYQDFEENQPTHTDEIPPFCGRSSLKNQKLFELSSLPDLFQYPKVCFAYLGNPHSTVTITYEYITAHTSGNLRYRYADYDIRLERGDSWKFQCVDVKQLIIDERWAAEYLDLKLSSFKFNIKAGDFYVDSFYIGTNDLFTDTDGINGPMRKIPNKWLTGNKQVTGTKEAGFNIQFSTMDCQHDIGPIGITGGMASTSGDVTDYSASSWPGTANVRNERLAYASPPLSGTFDLSMGNQTLTAIPANPTEEEFAVQIEKFYGAGKVQVQREGTCSGYTYDVSFTTIGGDKPQIKVDSTHLQGLDVTSGVSTVQDGSIYLSPIPGDMVRTFYETPQVSVKINNIPSKCEGDCSFSWSDALMVTMTGFTPTQGQAGITLTITGTGFDTYTENSLVSIGGVACGVTSASSTTLQCTVGERAYGVHDVMVTDKIKGSALDSSGQQFTYTFEVSGISPNTGSLSGGTMITIAGHGFNTVMSVTMGAGICAITSVEYATIVCVTPPGSGIVSVDVTVDGITESTSFTYSNPSSAITNISPETGVVGVNSTVTISGTGFGDNMPPEAFVALGDRRVKVLSWTDTVIEAVMLSLAPGSYDLNVYTGAQGYADSSAISPVEYTLKISAVEPDIGSLAGGTSLTLTGEGFPTDSEHADISVGHGFCDITSITSQQIICSVDNPGETHLITNNGKHHSHGQGYAFDPPVIVINVGDSVKWQWEFSELLSSINGLIIQQTETETSGTLADGFSSGMAKSMRGFYEFQFSNPGNYYYWSGYVDIDESIMMRGQIIVRDTTFLVAPVILTIDGYESDLTLSRKRKKRSAACDDSEATCTDVAPQTVTTGNAFNFIVAECSTPYINGIAINSKVVSGKTSTGTKGDVLTVTGSGFGSEICQNMIYIGDYSCSVSFASSTEVQCILGALSDDITIGIPLTVSVYVKNQGYALNTIGDDIERTVTLLPSVESVTPTTGSVKGGTMITISGFGFGSSPSVSIVGMSCKVNSTTDVAIVCSVPALQSGIFDIDVSTLSPAGQILKPVCKTNCTFTYTSALTPSVSDVSPTDITEAETTIYITGSAFGVSDRADVEVYVGKSRCDIVVASNMNIQCLLSYPIAGDDQELQVWVPNGYADVSITVSVNLLLTSITPSVGSIHGGTLVTLAGLGFDPDDSHISGADCDIQAITTSQIVCITGEGSGDVDMTVVSGEIESSPHTFSFSAESTPTITAVNPVSANSGDTITLSGTNLGDVPGDINITIDDASCEAASASPTQVICTLGTHSAGLFIINVNVQPYGIASSTVEFTYELAVDNIHPSTGSFGGDQAVTITGRGFDPASTEVTICGAECELDRSPSPTEIICQSPSTSGSGTKACAVLVSVGESITAETSDGYIYDSSITPTITGVSPRRGGTGGGTTLTISGTGFGNDVEALNVTIAGAICIVSTVSSSEVICVTEPRHGSVEAKVRVEINDQGIATQISADFEYVDVWSSIWTWGGNGIPIEGDMVVIPSTMTVVLDVDTPIIKLILIRGGKLIFDEVDVTLNAEIILITDGGTLQIGSENEPFQHKAIIMLHGHPRSPELPIYGTKVIAVREGTLELHGKPVNMAWTRLGSTASSGATSVVLEAAVDWPVGSEIAIASTGDHTSMMQNEKRQIVAISADGKTLTLDLPLQYEHLGETIDVTDGVTLEARAEVGLLSRNIVVKGSDNEDWHTQIEACEEGFDTGESAVQTCFQGRFGEETGSDQFGAQILFHAPGRDSNLAVGHLENVELSYVGQAFRVGRYAIHFHLNGIMQGSYVRSCAIHNSFNRAVNIHASNQILIEHTVAYDIMGGAFFFEDGIETGNIWQYNLAIFVTASTSLQNADITPAAFWLTNPNNTIRHNAAAGGSHFGFWYRLHKHPEGPSKDNNYCIQHVPLGEFHNNSAHSLGWFGLWIFQHYYPMVGDSPADGTCNVKYPVPAVFNGFTVWNCDKGSEATGQGALQYKNFLMVNNRITGVEVKLMKHTYSNNTDALPMVADSVIASYAGVLNSQDGRFGVSLPLARDFVIRNTTFVNYDTPGKGVFFSSDTVGITGEWNGGFTHLLQNIQYDNCFYKTWFRWPMDTVLHDLDGTTTGVVGGKILPTMNTLPYDKCNVNSEYSSNDNVPGSVCAGDVKFHRFSFNRPTPASLEGRDIIIANQYGSDRNHCNDKRVTHPYGWHVLLLDGETTEMYFDYSEHITNLSYHGVIYDLEPGEFVIVSHNLTQTPHKFSITNDSRDESKTDLSYEESFYGDWTFDTNKLLFNYIVSDRDAKHPNGTEERVDRQVDLNVYLCKSANCSVPDADVAMAPESRTKSAVFWSDIESWSTMNEGMGGNYGNGRYGLPTAGDDILIPKEMWMVLDVENLPKFNRLYLEGVLEFDPDPKADGSFYDLELNVELIMIKGGRLIVGSEDLPFQGKATIVLRGNHHTEEMILDFGPVVGSKAIGVFGGLDLHGRQIEQMWTRLATTVDPGQNRINLTDPVEWPVGAEIIVTTTSFSPHESERGRIIGISSDNLTLTLDINFEHRHIATYEMVNGQKIGISAEVGLLSSNVRVVGEEYAELQKQSFGARVLVGKMTDEQNKIYKGFARLSNVEFYNGGQEGFTDNYDPRYTLAFLDLGEVNPNITYVRKCSLNWNFAPGIGVIGTSNMNIESNVIYHTVGSGIILQGKDHIVKDNLVVMVMFPGVYNGRFEDWKISWDAGIEINEVDGPLEMYDNVVAGSERAGYHGDGQTCRDVSNNPDKAWRGNEAHAILYGWVMLPGLWDGAGQTCTHMTGFKFWKTYDYGLYMNTEAASVVISEYISVDNNIGFMAIIYQPNAKFHEYKSKSVEVRDSIFIGTSSAFDCDSDVLSVSMPFVKHSEGHRHYRLSRGMKGRPLSRGKFGVQFTTFMSTSNGAPFEPIPQSINYPALRGNTIIKDTLFMNFETSCGNRKDYAVASNPRNDDFMHPISMRGITLQSVQNKVFFFRPNIDVVNPGDCVDMDCDGLKKTLVRDEDGTFLGSAGAAAIAESEWEWGGDPRRGLGDYRIPKTLIMDDNGNPIDINTVVNGRGIIRDETCTLSEADHAYYRAGLDYLAVQYESLDWDTESRRFSPVAILSDTGYVDLVNGPEDNGWCMGWACQLRLSLLSFIIATGHMYTMHLTGSNPQGSRFHLLNADQSQAIVIAVFSKQPWRLDVSVEGRYILPNNGYYDNEGRLLLRAADNTYIPNVATAGNGDNYYDRSAQLLYIVCRGIDPVTINTAASTIITFNLPMMSVDEFFGENIVNNLAAFFNIPSSKIRIAEAVREVRREKRSTILTFTVEIYDLPMNTTGNYSLGEEERDTNIYDISKAIIDSYQLGELDEILGVEVISMDVIEPPADTNSSLWQAMAAENTMDEPVSLLVPAELTIVNEIIPGSRGLAFPSYPVLQMVDSSGDTLTQVGSIHSPWQVEVTLLSQDTSGDASLLGSTTVEFSFGGQATFPDLAISQAGEYALQFNILSPAEASSITIETEYFIMAELELTASMVNLTEPFAVGDSLELYAQIVDASTQNPLEDINWMGHTWVTSITASDVCLGETSFDDDVVSMVTNSAAFVMTTTTPGMCPVTFTFTSDPNDLTFSYTRTFLIYPMEYWAPVAEIEKNIILTFDADFSTHGAGYEDNIKAAVFNTFWPIFMNTTWSNISVYEGSIVVAFTVSGTIDAVNGLIDVIQSAVAGPLVLDYAGPSTIQSFTYLLIDGERQQQPEESMASAASPAVITGALIGSLAALAIILIIIILIIKKVKGQGKGGDLEKLDDNEFDSQSSKDSWPVSRKTTMSPTDITSLGLRIPQHVNSLIPGVVLDKESYYDSMTPVEDVGKSKAWSVHSGDSGRGSQASYPGTSRINSAETSRTITTVSNMSTISVSTGGSAQLDICVKLSDAC